MSNSEEAIRRIQRAEEELAAAKSELARIDKTKMEFGHAYRIGNNYGMEVMVGNTDLGVCYISLSDEGKITLTSEWSLAEAREKAGNIKAQHSY